MIYIYVPLNSNGVKNSCELLHDYILKNELPIKKVFTIRKLFYLVVVNFFKKNHIYIYSLNSIFLTFFTRNSYIIIHGYPEREHYSLFRHYLIRFSYYLSSYFSSNFIFVSRSTLRKFSYNIKNKYIFHNINNSFNVDDIKLKNKIIYWGRVTESKGIERIINIHNDLIKYKNDFELHIWGNGSKNYIQYLKRLGNFEYHGEFLNYEQIINYHGSINGFIFISLNSTEPFGITYIEAAKLGCCIIIPENAGAFEVLSGTGIVNFDSFNIDNIFNLFEKKLFINAIVNDDRLNIIESFKLKCQK